MLDVERAIKLYTAKLDSVQALFLSALAHRLTIDARSAYGVEGDTVDNPGQLRKVNELMHRILGQQFKLMRNDTERYPDDIFIRMLFEGASDCGFGEIIGSRFEEAFHFAN